MQIRTGKEDRNGEFQTRVIGDSKEGEDARTAIARIATRYLGIIGGEAALLYKDGKVETDKGPRRFRWNTEWHKTQHETPAPGLFIEGKHTTRLFEIATRWDAEKRLWVMLP